MEDCKVPCYTSIMKNGKTMGSMVKKNVLPIPYIQFDIPSSFLYFDPTDEDNKKLFRSLDFH